MGEEEIITDPVLMALRKFDEEHTNKIATKLFRELFDAMAEDELQVGTHIFYGDIPDEDLAVAKATVQDMGLETDDGDITYPDFKGFIESKDVEVASGRPPSNLVTSLMTNRMDGWLEDNEVTKLYSPRSWRMKLQAEEDEPKTARKGKKKKSSSDGDDEEEDDEGAASPRGKDKKDRKDKKDKKKDKDEEEDDDDDKKDKKDKKVEEEAEDEEARRTRRTKRTRVTRRKRRKT